MKRITVPEEGIETLFGSYDENLKRLESLFNVRIRTQGHDLLVEGDPPNLDRVDRVIGQLSSLLRDGFKLSNADVKTASDLVAQDNAVDLRDHFLKGSLTAAGKRRVAPKTVNQRRYLDAIEQHDIVFGIGPAGTGKTYLAMAQAVAFLVAKKVSRIILARPAVEAGEKLGVRRESRDHGRHHPDRSAGRPDVRAGRGDEGRRRDRRHLVRLLRRSRCRAPQAGPADREGVRSVLEWRPGSSADASRASGSFGGDSWDGGRGSRGRHSR